MKKHEKKVVYQNCQFYPAENAEVSINLGGARVKVRANKLKDAERVATSIAGRLGRRNPNTWVMYR